MSNTINRRAATAAEVRHEARISLLSGIAEAARKYRDSYLNNLPQIETARREMFALLNALETIEGAV